MFVNSTSQETDLTKIRGPETFLNDIKTKKTTIEEAQHTQQEFSKYLRKIRIGSTSVKQKERWLIFIWFLTEKITPSNLKNATVQWFLKLQEKQLKEEGSKN